MSNVIPLIRPESIDAAWEEFAKHASRLHDEPRLILSRSYMEQHIRLHERFRRLFLRANG